MDELLRAGNPYGWVDIEFTGGEPLLNFGLIRRVFLYVKSSYKEHGKKITFRDKELNRLRKEAAEFPEKSRLEIQKAVAEAVKAAEAGHAQELVALKKDAETEKRLSGLKIRTLEETAARQFMQIEGLGQRLEEAKKQVQDIAIKAIEGASGAKALSHVSQLAMEQAKIRPSQG